MIQDAPTKARLLSGLGVDAVVTQTFNRELADVAATEFLAWVQRYLPTLSAVYVGENFRFGRGRSGNVAQLLKSSRELGLTVFSAPRVNLDGEPISSTRIRGLLEAGEIGAANTLLGYSYFAEGVVTPGKRLGRGIGFPTLNLAWAPGLRPRFGVYVVRVASPKIPAFLPAVANYGLRPTVEQSTEPRLESHILGPCPLDAGDAITVDWLRFLRPEKKFAGVDELRAQIERDCAAALAQG